MKNKEVNKSNNDIVMYALRNENGKTVYVNDFQWEVIRKGEMKIAILPELYERLMNNEESAFQELFDTLNPMFIALNVSKAIALIETILIDDDIKGEYPAKMREGFDFKVVIEVKTLEEIEEFNNKI